MRISDWSSDVCSSDLQFLAAKEQISICGSVINDWVAEQILEQRDAFLTPTLAEWRRRLDRYRLRAPRSEEHTSELQSLMRISYAVFCLKKKNKKITKQLCEQ